MKVVEEKLLYNFDICFVFKFGQIKKLQVKKRKDNC